MKVFPFFALLLSVIIGSGAKFYSKVDRQDESVVKSLYNELSIINSKITGLQNQIDGLEQRFNESQEPTTTTQNYWVRWKMNQFTVPTTTKSPAEICRESYHHFTCFNDTSVCFDSNRTCDKVANCNDGSDELFCEPEAPEQIQEIPGYCPPGYHGSFMSQKCFWFSGSGKEANWIDALVDCTRRNSHLVTIDSRLEQEALVHFLKNQTRFENGGNLWLGATMMLRNSTSKYYFTTPTSNHQWTWLATDENFSDVEYTNWIGPFRQQPDNKNNMEYCLEMRSDYRWQWNDKDCKTMNPYMCQVEMTKQVRNTISA